MDIYEEIRLEIGDFCTAYGVAPSKVLLTAAGRYELFCSTKIMLMKQLSVYQVTEPVEAEDGLIGEIDGLKYYCCLLPGEEKNFRVVLET